MRLTTIKERDAGHAALKQWAQADPARRFVAQSTLSDGTLTHYLACKNVDGGTLFAWVMEAFLSPMTAQRSIDVVTGGKSEAQAPP